MPWELLLLVGAVAITYANALDAAWQFDDFAAILGNDATRSLTHWWQALPGIRPLLKLSFALTHELGGDARAAHATNIVIHALNACLLWALWRCWLPSLAPRLARPDVAALLGALLFALHPATTEAVTYASGRSISLAATFMLGALLADERARAQPTSRLAHWVGPASFALALAVRETAVIMPLIPLLRSWAMRESLRAQCRRLWPYAAILALAALAAAMTPGYHLFFSVSLSTRAVGEQVASQLLAHGYLLTHPLLGMLNIDPDLRMPTGFSWQATGYAMLLGALFLTAFAARKRHAWIAFAILWYFLQLAPSNSLLPRLDLANDRHLYLALAGPMLLVACLIVHGFARARWLGGATAIGLCAALALATVLRNKDYRSEIALWQATAQVSPNKARVWTNLGHAYRSAGDRARASAAFARALTLDPANEKALIALDLLESSAAPQSIFVIRSATIPSIHPHNQP